MSSRNEGKRKRRGSVNNTRRLEAFGAGKDGTVVEWESANSELLKGVVNGITQLGGAVTIGLSRDGGAYSLTLLLDGDRETLWFNGNADLDEELRAVIGKLESMTDSG